MAIKNNIYYLTVSAGKVQNCLIGGGVVRLRISHELTVRMLAGATVTGIHDWGGTFKGFPHMVAGKVLHHVGQDRPLDVLKKPLLSPCNYGI